MTRSASKSQAELVSNVLGLYKAEWLNGKLFELFTEPEYIGELRTRRPCVLVGGRGTGKTTVLRGLSYEGQFARAGSDVHQILSWDSYGLYLRINTNRVTAFQGPELPEDKWVAVFAHYVNLTLCQLLLEFVSWFEVKTGKTVELPPARLRAIRASLHLSGEGSLARLTEEIEYLLIQFEAVVNTIADEKGYPLSMQGAPVDALTTALTATELFRGKQFFFLIDEFENLEDYQQRVLNTLIKHVTPAYTFKVGVREQGWRQKTTLNANERLTSPADYALIEIATVLSGDKFTSFADKVVASRIAHHESPGPQPSTNIASLLPGWSALEEAAALLDRNDERALRTQIEMTIADPDTRQKALALPLGTLYFLRYWSERDKQSPFGHNVRSWLSGDKEWQTRFNNHFYASLFLIRRKKRGIRKYYCGWDTFLALSDGNIRYLLELVHNAFLGHFADGGQIGQSISQEIQTRAAQDVGRKNLTELEGLSVDGAQLTKLLLSLGRVFQLLAYDPVGHAPEVNQFRLKPGPETSPQVEMQSARLLNGAVMHLALVRILGSKLAGEDTKDYDYMVHPIYAAFFVFSHRLKRKCLLSPEQLLALINQPKETIREILVQNNREADSELPDQLQLFDTYYA